MRTRRTYPADCRASTFALKWRPARPVGPPAPLLYPGAADHYHSWGPRFITHVGCRCPNANCATAGHCYRSAAAEALALPGFTFGLDVVVLAGQSPLGPAPDLDEVHRGC